MFDNSYRGCTTQATQASNGELTSVRIEERTHGGGRLDGRTDPSRRAFAGALPVYPEGGCLWPDHALSCEIPSARPSTVSESREG